MLTAAAVLGAGQPALPGFLNSLAGPLEHYGLWAVLLLVLVEDFGIPVPGETVLIHGAAGGIGTAGLQVAKGLGARTIAVVSTDIKEAVARSAGADLVFRAADRWKDAVREQGGADVVLDPVGGDRFTDSLRSLRPGGRLLVVGFTDGSIPEVRVNRLLLGNTEVVGAGWGSYILGGWDTDARARRAYLQETAGALEELIAADRVAPIVGASFALDRAADALKLIESRAATGKIVLDVT